MTEKPVLFRKRLIPSECIRLDNDEVLFRSDSLLVTRWKTLRPKKDLSHGSSCYLLNQGWKVSRFSRYTVENTPSQKRLKSRFLLLPFKPGLEGKPFSQSQRRTHLLVLRYYRRLAQQRNRFLSVYRSSCRRSYLP